MAATELGSHISGILIKLYACSNIMYYQETVHYYYYRGSSVVAYTSFVLILFTDTEMVDGYGEK